MPDSPAPAPFVARKYQEEIFNSAIRGNVIAALDTGTGKTFIAVNLIKWISSRPSDGHQVVCYLAPTVPLVRQQAAFIHSQLGHVLKTKSFTGEDMVDLWDEAQWLKEFASLDVLVMTPQILLDVLSHARWSLTKVSLLVFDEAHHARKNHVYAQILRNYVAKLPLTQRPKVFGLTASPTWDHKNPTKAKQALEELMNATIIAVKVHQTELSTFAYKPVEQVFLYPSMPLAPTEGSSASMLSLVAGIAPELPELAGLELRRDVLYASLGPYAAEYWTHDFLTSLLAKKVQASGPPSLRPSLARLQAELVSIAPRFSHHSADLDSSQISPKLQLLTDVLNEHHTEHFKCIIFAEQKHVAYALAAILPRLPDTTWISSAALVGHDEGMNSKHQGDVVSAFRSNVYNVLVATSVGEEGLDFQACHLVVRFDGLQTLKAYVQSRGRARRQNSTYVVLLPAEDPSALAKYEEMRDAEPLLRQQYAAASVVDLSGDMDVDEPSALDAELQERYVVETTGATMTYDDAIGKLERLCAAAPSDSYGGILRPLYTVTELAEHSFTATVELPTALPLPRTALRYDTGSQARASKREAKRAAAFAAVKALHLLSAFDDFLLPVNHKRDKRGEDAYGRKAEEIDDIPELMLVDVVRPWAPLGEEVWVHDYCIDGVVACAFVTGNRMPDVDFALDVGMYSLRNPRPMRVDSERRTLLSEFTKTVLRLCGVYMKPLEAPLTFYLALIVPHGHELHVEGMQAFIQQPTTTSWDATLDAEPIMVVNRIRMGHLHVFDRRTTVTASDRPVLVEGPNPELAFECYTAYYDNLFAGRKYTVDVPPSAKLFLLRQLPRTGNIFYHITAETGLDRPAEQKKTRGLQRMVPETLCLRLLLSAAVAKAVQDLPILTRRLTDVVRAQALDLPYIPVNALIEATTLPHAGMAFDNQRLETLGDAFLKLGVSVYAFNRYPFKHEGQLTNVRIPSISNRSLLARARAFGLQRFLTGEVGSRKKWTPLLGDGVVEMPRRSMQECVEALLGAAFATGGVSSALKVGERLGLCFGPADQSWSERYPPMPPPSARRPLLQQLQHDLNYAFTNETLLLEAVTHRTLHFSETPSYERLEFLGDALIDMVVIHDLFTRYPSATCGQLSWARQRAVCNTTLAWIAVNKLNVHECLMQNNIELAKAIDIAKVQLLADPVADVVRHGWKMDMPKALGDVVEAVCAAMFIDMNHDYERVAKQIRFIFGDVLALLHPRMPRDPSTELMLFTGTHGCGKVKFRKSASVEGGRNNSFTVVVHGIEIVKPVQSSSLSLAKSYAAEAALEVQDDEANPFHMIHLCTCPKSKRRRIPQDDIDGSEETNEHTADETEAGFAIQALKAVAADVGPELPEVVPDHAEEVEDMLFLGSAVV
ncbi:hypothetical protein EXIGLDRAFT_640865 [Exidia glandulosa HHB12029]|uniref:P-loop containing nucleoside triphosphate hydrolase protein n=1 Tax=Exidia glandulosa HHB12029 TaxID=1314781 RepID=A0A165MDQ3_EXIGL|nr:hypothetical protein EXIGLDRAFT_640865 [Exidia glandulosa HHB12029]